MLKDICTFCKKNDNGICYDGNCHFGEGFVSKASMDPDAFAYEMRMIARGDDEEVEHSDMDDLMCEILTSLGYEEGVQIFKDAHKWYA